MTTQQQAREEFDKQVAEIAEFEKMCEVEYRRSLFNQQVDIPILGEYCWMHDGPGNGGWTCAECYHEAQRD